MGERARVAASGRQVESWRYGRARDAVLTGMAALLARSTRPLWYAETLVLSARYQQWLGTSGWSKDSVRRRDRLDLWRNAAQPRLADSPVAVLEFGVASGMATKWWADTGIAFAAWHGFDTFEGLPTAWGR